MGSKTSFHPGAGTALLIIDPQVDFCPGGALAVPGGDEIIPVINRYVELFDARRLPIYVSRDWHPSETAHFLQSGGQWPPHCVQGSAGAAFHPDLRLPADAVIVSKGMDSRRDDYSPLPITDANGRSFSTRLKQAGIAHLYLCGLATDYCVKWTALEARADGFGVTILTDAVRGVNLSPDESRTALDEIVRAGGELADYRVIAGHD